MRRLLLLVSLLIVGFGCTASDKSSQNTVTATDGYVVLGASEDGLLRVEAPTGSIDATVEVSVAALDPSGLDDPLVGDLDLLQAYELGPEGSEFDDAVVVSTTLSMADLGLAAGQYPLLTVGLGEPGGLEEIDHMIEIDGDDVRIWAEVEHFSVWMIAVGPNAWFELGVAPDSLEMEVGAIADVEVSVNRHGTAPWTVDLEARYEGPIEAAGGGTVASRDSIGFTVECLEPGSGIFGIQASTGHHIVEFAAKVPVTCSAQTATTTVSTTTTVPPPEAFDTAFPVFGINVADDGTLVLIGFGDVASFDPSKPVGANNPKQIPLPGAPDGCTDSNVSKGDHCGPELLNYDSNQGCYWILLPSELNCYDDQGGEVISTSGGDTPCPPSTAGGFDGRNEKSTKTFDAICDPQAPEYLGATVTVNGGTEEVPFFRKGNGELGYIQPKAGGGHEYVACFKFKDHTFEFSDVSFANDTITARTRWIHGDTVVTRTISWPECEYDATKDITETVDQPPPGGPGIELSGTTYSVDDSTYATDTLRLTNPSGEVTEITFPNDVAYDQFSAVTSEGGNWYIYLAGVNICCDENDEPFDEPGPDHGAGAIYRYDSVSGEVEVISDNSAQVPTMVIVDDVLWAAQIFPNRMVPIPLN